MFLGHQNLKHRNRIFDCLSINYSFDTDMYIQETQEKIFENTEKIINLYLFEKLAVEKNNSKQD